MCVAAIPAAWAAMGTMGKISLVMSGASAVFAGASAYSQASASRYNAQVSARNYSYQAIMARNGAEASAQQMEYAGQMAMVQGAIQARDMLSQAAQMEFQAAVAKNNAQIAQHQQKDAHRRGEQEATDVQRRMRVLHGSQRASMAARGLDLTHGTPSNILEDTRFFGAVDTNTTRHNAAKEVWEHRLTEQNEDAQAGLFKSTAQSFRAMGAYSLRLGAAQNRLHAQAASQERIMGNYQGAVYDAASAQQRAIAKSIRPMTSGLVAFGTSVATSAAAGTFLGGLNVPGKSAVASSTHIRTPSMIPFAM